MKCMVSISAAAAALALVATSSSGVDARRLLLSEATSTKGLRSPTSPIHVAFASAFAKEDADAADDAAGAEAPAGENEDSCAPGTPKHDRFEIMYCDSHVCDVCAEKAEDEEVAKKNFDLYTYCKETCADIKEKFDGCVCDGDDNSPISNTAADAQVAAEEDAADGPDAPKYVLATTEETCWGSELGNPCSGKPTWDAGTDCPSGYEKVMDEEQCKEAAGLDHLGKMYWAQHYMACQFPAGCALDTKFGQPGKLAFNLDKSERCQPMLGQSVCVKV